MRRYGALIAGSLIVANLTGCRPAPKNAEKQPAAPKKKDSETRRINATIITNTAYGPPPKREVRWILRSREGAVTVGSSGIKTGTATECSGSIMRDGVVSATFTSDAADADRGNDYLILRGHVVIHSLKPAGQLRCDSARYEAAAHLFKAKGNVRVKTLDGTTGTMAEVWANSDLSKIATPDMYGKQPW